MQTVICDAQGARAPEGATVERELEIIVPAEAVALSEEHRAFQHVGVVEGAPGVADTVRAGADDYAERSKQGKARARPGKWRRRHDGNLFARQHLAQPPGISRSDVAKAEGVADHHATLKAKRP